MSLAILPFLGSIAFAAQPLSDQQMDGVYAGFDAFAHAEAEGLVGLGGVVQTQSATGAFVIHIATATLGETSSRLWKSISGAQSAVFTSQNTPNGIPGM
jgi:hypothetical protein